MFDGLSELTSVHVGVACIPLPLNSQKIPEVLPAFSSPKVNSSLNSGSILMLRKSSAFSRQVLFTWTQETSPSQVAL